MVKSIDLFISYAVVCLFILAWYRRRTTMVKTHRSITLTSKISYTDLSHKEQPAPLPARKKQLLCSPMISNKKVPSRELGNVFYNMS